MEIVHLIGICLEKKNYVVTALEGTGSKVLKIPKEVNKTPPNAFEFQLIRTIALISLCVAVSYSLRCSHTLIVLLARL